MTDADLVSIAVRLVAEAKPLMAERTFSIDRFSQDELRRVADRVAGFDGSDESHRQDAIRIVQSIYRLLCYATIQDKDLPEFLEWGKRAYGFMPAFTPNNIRYRIPDDFRFFGQI